VGKKILIVDDEAHIRILLEQTLEDLEAYVEGLVVLQADNGREALEIIQKELPDMVILDVMMPEMNGFEVCDIVKNKLKLAGVYIVMLTAKGQEFDRIKGIESGADVYMTKPFDPDAMVHEAKKVFGIK